MPRRHIPKKHEPFKADISCQRKRRFGNEHEALKAIEDAGLMDIRLELRTYLCPYCDGWHLSSSK